MNRKARRNKMYAINRVLQWTPESELTQVVEPLADFICASEKPDVVLRSVVAVLRHQIHMTNDLAATHYAASHRMNVQAV
jgi:hypothetical protein